ncbi:hypothetical protein BT96DRAFT_632711 [Gymnopus androsaceus JB14]|uniref:Uncharacterized protein n=1 Tax=Gymnopus androsaceus JB14 TaxID=1447944 RepID=A0A6A4HR32_9AGAR|nr:hypothetical protein BT96DRAFT_632711 [Gymnopus androsaceus JB14]
MLPYTRAAQHPGLTNANSQTARPRAPRATPPASSRRSSSCEHCHMKPKYFDGGKTHPYCSKTCASNATVNKYPKAYNRRHNSNSLVSGTCDFCHRRPKSPGSTFCSEACAKDATLSTHPTGNTTGRSKVAPIDSAES